MTTIAEIQRATAEWFEVGLCDLLSNRSTRQFAWPRQVAIYLAREITSASLPAIGRAFHRDHTTVMYALSRVDERRQWHLPTAMALHAIPRNLGIYDHPGFFQGVTSGLEIDGPRQR